jgi:hypothetical protein
MAFQTIGILVAVSYYVISIRNQNRARQIQTFNTLYSRLSDPEYVITVQELLYMRWDDYHDFETRYGTDVNPENAAKRYAIWYFWDGMGHLFRKGLIDRDTLYSMSSAGNVLWFWDKFGSVIKEIRRRYGLQIGIDFEYLARETKIMMEQKGVSAEIPETYGRYIPDQ